MKDALRITCLSVKRMNEECKGRTVMEDGVKGKIDVLGLSKIICLAIGWLGVIVEVNAVCGRG